MRVYVVGMSNETSGDEPATDTDRKVVKTYVPAYQKQCWKEQADELGMTQSEYVRCMVQAGRGLHESGGEDIDESL